MHVPSITSLIAVFSIALFSATDGLELVPRVIAGVSVRDRCRAPYNSMVALQFYAGFFPMTFCSAVMMTDTYLITTAECILTMVERRELVTTANIGERDTMIDGEPGEQRIDIKDFKIHPFFNRSSKANNIGMIQLARPAQLGRCVKPAARMEDDPNACNDVDESCQIVDWGSYTETQEPTNSRLPRAASVTVYSDLISVLLTSGKSLDQPPPVGTLYAEAADPRQKACFFGWGGIVSCRRNGNNVLRGITSTHNCNSQRPLPILIIDVPYYQSWIDRCTTSWNLCDSARGRITG